MIWGRHDRNIGRVGNRRNRGFIGRGGGIHRLQDTTLDVSIQIRRYSKATPAGVTDESCKDIATNGKSLCTCI